MKKRELKWYDRKRWFCGLPFTFTKYGLSEDRFFVETGLFSLKHSEVRLYRILDLTLTRSLVQRIFGLGTIHVNSSDKDLKQFDIVNIKKSWDVKEVLSQAVEQERRAARVAPREFMSDGHSHNSSCGGNHDPDELDDDDELD